MCMWLVVDDDTVLVAVIVGKERVSWTDTCASNTLRPRKISNSVLNEKLSVPYKFEVSLFKLITSTSKQVYLPIIALYQLNFS